MKETKTSGKTVMLVEDDRGVAEALTEVLESNGYEVVVADGGMAAKAALEHARPDLIVLDLILPDMDGLVLCADLKALAEAPIIICSATGRKRDTVLGLKLGADDFIAKPFDIYEFEARVEAVMRRRSLAKNAEASSPTSDEIRVGELVIDRARRRTTLGGDILHLTPIEYRLLSALAARPDEVLSREDLAQIVWGYQDASVGRTVDVHIRRLRVKLASVATPPPPIVSVRGFGYKLSTEENGEAVSAAS